ncbi:MAG: NAD-dependent epimerase/dehydratase family protein [Candidatus Altiarchaeales archaeon]|nr:NAD-dependent epimerase/dehydratase family protein [Candidatus Altiarchaeales archaeon]MBD3416619.1 NAD-dependent epimerase/dehydratase family protein [Candidatus Altiarchaeales archaeon]
MKRVLVTGGAGFIGSHLCDRLLGGGWHVICMDNLLTGSMRNIDHLLGEKDFEFIEHDVSKYIEVEGDLDYILHFACPASPIDYQKLPIQTMKVDSLGTLNTLGVAKAKGSRYLQASTSEVYGDPLVHPQPESYWGNVNPIGPRSVYDEAKRFSEALVMAYHRTHAIDTRIVRIFNTYGPRMRIDDGRVVPTFISQALKGEDLSVFGDGKQTRSFCYITDQVEGILKLMESDYHEPVNVGNPGEFNMLELAEIIIELTGSKSKIGFEPLPEDDPKVRCPDIALAGEVLGWKPKVHLREGLSKTIDYFKEVVS